MTINTVNSCDEYAVGMKSSGICKLKETESVLWREKNFFNVEIISDNVINLDTLLLQQGAAHDNIYYYFFSEV